jgi:hypothetical protein
MIKVAPEGYIYTNGTDFGRKIHLASGSNGNEWYTIPLEEYEKIMAERNAEKYESILNY